MLIRERNFLAVCSVAFSVLVTPVFADVSGSDGKPLGPDLLLPAKVERPGKSGRRAAAAPSEQDRRQALFALAYAPEGQNRAQRKQRRAPAMAGPAAGWGASSSPLIAEARRYLGTNPTKRRTLWCGAFMNFVLERTGHAPGSSDLAKSFASYGTRISGPQVGAIAVMSRGPTGGHVGIVTGVDPSGNPIIISGNHENRVAEVPYPRGRIFAYVMPDASASAGGIMHAAGATDTATQDN